MPSAGNLASWISTYAPVVKVICHGMIIAANTARSLCLVSLCARRCVALVYSARRLLMRASRRFVMRFRRIE